MSVPVRSICISRTSTSSSSAMTAAQRSSSRSMKPSFALVRLRLTSVPISAASVRSDSRACSKPGNVCLPPRGIISKPVKTVRRWGSKGNRQIYRLITGFLFDSPEVQHLVANIDHAVMLEKEVGTDQAAKWIAQILRSSRQTGDSDEHGPQAVFADVDQGSQRHSDRSFLGMDSFRIHSRAENSNPILHRHAVRDKCLKSAGIDNEAVAVPSQETFHLQRSRVCDSHRDSVHPLAPKARAYTGACARGLQINPLILAIDYRRVALQNVQADDTIHRHEIVGAPQPATKLAEIDQRDRAGPKVLRPELEAFDMSH